LGPKKAYKAFEIGCTIKVLRTVFETGRFDNSEEKVEYFASDV